MSEMEGSPDDGNGDRDERDVPSTAQRIAANDQVGREWIRELADQAGVSKWDLLMLSRKNDPDWIGTDTHHAKGAWFRALWEHAVDDRSEPTIHVRGVHYATISRDEEIEPPTQPKKWSIYQNTQRCFDYLTNASNYARVLGYVPYEGLVDEKNAQEQVSITAEHQLDPDLQVIETPTVVQAPHLPQVDDQARLQFDTVDEIIDYLAHQGAQELAEQLHFDRERAQPYHIELWSEKTLPGEVRSMAQLAGANVIVEGEGDLSATVAHDFAQRVNDAGKPAIVLYLSDFDPVGSNMPSAMAGKVSHHSRTGALAHRAAITRLAITAEQVEAYDLPRKPIDTKDVEEGYETRVEEWQQEHDGAVELNVLEADIDLFQSIVREGVSQYRDPELTAKQEDAIDEWEANAEAIIRSTLQEHREELDEQLAEAAAWCEEFNAALADARDHLETLRELTDDPRYTRWDSWATPVRGSPSSSSTRSPTRRRSRSPPIPSPRPTKRSRPDWPTGRRTHRYRFGTARLSATTPGMRSSTTSLMSGPTP